MAGGVLSGQKCAPQMCGIAGFLDLRSGRSPEAMTEVVTSMRDRLVHRGPDDAGVWVDAESGVALAHRRLSILDLSPNGHQPMFSQDRRFAVVYNGEIYNFLELRAELEGLGSAFRGGSDTEVLLASIQQWGLESTLTRCNGMFALAVWDRVESRLWLARDRVGKKPLYYGQIKPGLWAFASELKAFLAVPEFSREICEAGLTAYVRYGFVPAPYSIYKGLGKLSQGSFLCLGQDSQPRLYPDFPAENLPLEETLRRAVRRRMVSDVPLGAFLSGGIDSSLTVALMQEQSSQRIRTFSLGFREAAYDESPYARQVAQHLGTDHTEFTVTAQEAQGVLPLLPRIYDEPFSDSSQIPTYLVCQLARREVTVVLSGDGGDELFGGYNRYPWARRFWAVSRHLPSQLRPAVAGLLQQIGRGSRNFSPALYEKILRLAALLKLSSPRDLYRAMLSPWREPEAVLRRPEAAPTWIDSAPAIHDIFRWMMDLDFHFYLPDDILTKVDRASMAVGLEARCPLLDANVVTASKAISTRQLVVGGQTKYPLLELLHKRLPPAYFQRPKAGFAIPLRQWLRGDLKDWAWSLLSATRTQPWFHDQLIFERWREHQEGSRDWSVSLWAILMFQAWLEP